MASTSPIHGGNTEFVQVKGVSDTDVGTPLRSDNVPPALREHSTSVQFAGSCTPRYVSSNTVEEDRRSVPARTS
jgi:hypothetical protein